VTFYAIILLGHQYRLVSLTPTLSCLRSASNSTDRSSLYRAFAAASVLDMLIFADVCLSCCKSTPSDSFNALATSCGFQASQIFDAGDNADTDDPEHGNLDFQIHERQDFTRIRLDFSSWLQLLATRLS
jgi:hypothetical protein